MAEEVAEGEDLDLIEDDAEGGGGGKKKLLMIVIPVVLLLLIGGGAGAYFAGVFGGSEEEVTEPELSPAERELLEEQAAVERAATGQVVFFEVPEMLVNLNTGGKSETYLKIQVSLELDNPEALPQLEQLMPRVVDNFQTYLRELRLEDLEGSAGVYRLKEELLIRVNAAVRPVRVNDILFREILVH